jgi:hypothetical protein
MGNRSMFVGLDVHKETIDVSIAEGDRHGEVRHDGVIASDLEPLDKVVRAFARRTDDSTSCTRPVRAASGSSGTSRSEVRIASWSVRR